ncbi:MAG: DUF368 domain-containing protein [Cyclobacteriaceae bacterium]|nr:DUF368 domain-containing protein [Cyclobacteriaceae bacterium]
MQQVIGWFLKGLAMGAANVIPGVSGGTIAFITGIFERLIRGIKSFDGQALGLLLRFRFRELAAKVDFLFLFSVFAGIGVSILSLARVLEWAFTNYETLTLAFFFGLIIASVLGVGRQVGSWQFSTGANFLVGTAIAVSIAFLPPAAPDDGVFYLFLCGVAAICSMVLPGLSGSYVLLLMGNYLLVLSAISAFEVVTLLPFLAGCLVGLILFSRLLSYLFVNFKDQTVALLTGFVAGSLLIIWPWKETQYLAVSGEKAKAIGYDWHLPSMDMAFFYSIVLVLTGFGLVWVIDKKGSNNRTTI